MLRDAEHSARHTGFPLRLVLEQVAAPAGHAFHHLRLGSAEGELRGQHHTHRFVHFVVGDKIIADGLAVKIHVGRDAQLNVGKFLGNAHWTPFNRAHIRMRTLVKPARFAYRPSMRWMRGFMMKPTKPRPSARAIHSVPYFPAFDFHARLPMMKTM